MQEGHPVAYFAITEAVKKLRQYLLGRFFVIRTDHRSLKELFLQVIQTPEQQIYVQKLLGYIFTIEYKTGSTNLAADALSHKEEEEPCLSSGLMLLSKPMSNILQDLKHENSTLPDLLELRQRLEDGKLYAAYIVVDGNLRFKGRFYVSSSSSLKKALMEEFHGTPMAGHGGIKRTMVRLSQLFFWPNMRTKVQDFVEKCVICQEIKFSTKASGDLLQPLPMPTKVWDDLTVDFIVGLPTSRGCTVIMVVVDRLTKYAHFGVLPSDFNATKVAQLFADIIVKHHGYPSSIITDRDTVFISLFWKQLNILSGIKLKQSTAYHRQTEGQTEFVNRGLEQYLRAFSMSKPSTWSRFLNLAEFSYNSHYNHSLKISPLKALYGRDPPLIPHYTSGTSKVQSVDELLMERTELLATLKRNLYEAQN